MRVRSCVWAVMLAMGVAASANVFAQQSSASVSVAPAPNVTGVLRSLASRSGVVFVGQVQSIVLNGGVVEITFKVQQPVLGSVGATYVLREWAGRWTGGQQRYQIGQRAMFFLHAPSAAGLSSPVDGMTGVVPVIPMGANVGPLLDVRMLGSRVSRAVGSPMAAAETGAIALADAETVVANWQVQPVSEPVKVFLPAGVRPAPVTDLPGERPLLEQVNVDR